MRMPETRANDIRAGEYDEDLDRRSEETEETDWTLRAVKSARLYEIDDETISVGLDTYEESGLKPEALVGYFTNLMELRARSHEEALSIDLDKCEEGELEPGVLAVHLNHTNQDYQVLEWQDTVYAGLRDICMRGYYMGGYYQGHGAEKVVVSTEQVRWSESREDGLNELTDALVADYYDVATDACLLPLSMSDERIREAIRNTLEGLEDDAVFWDEEDEYEDWEEYPRIYIELTFSKELLLPERASADTAVPDA
jgi:hypothetical protein